MLRTLAIYALLFLAQGASLWHGVTEGHRLCSRHGVLEETDTAATIPAEARERFWQKDDQTTASHHACSHVLFHSALESRSVCLEHQPPLGTPWEILSVPQQVRTSPLYLNAPKQSPPLVLPVS